MYCWLLCRNKNGCFDGKIALHLDLCDNEATLQYEILAKQLPSMNQRIVDAYKNTRDFVNFIKATPEAKINFVSEALAEQFTPFCFLVRSPTKGNTNEEKEAIKET
jgi:hypothetical protein